MRKEVRIGAAIGGVLIAVVIVYAIVNSRAHSTKKDQVTFDQGKGGATGDGTVGTDHAVIPEPPVVDHGDGTTTLNHEPTADPARTPSGDAAVPRPSHGDDVAAPSHPAKVATNWGALLSADRVEDVMPLQTHTPDPAPKVGADAAPLINELPTQNPTPRIPTDIPALGAGGGGSSSASSTPPAETTPTPAAPGKNYTIQSGDTFSSIARTTYGDAKYYKQIMKANPKVNPSRLKPGMTIKLPERSQFKQEASSAPTSGSTAQAPKKETAKALAPVNSATEYRVQSSDSLYRIALKLYNSPNKVDAIYQLNKETIGPDPAKLKLNMVLKLPEPPTVAK